MGRVCDNATNSSAANSSDGPVLCLFALSCRAIPQRSRADREFAGKMPQVQVKKTIRRAIRISRPTHASTSLAGINGLNMIAHRTLSPWFDFNADGRASP